MPRPGAGELQHFIVIEQLTQTRDENGGMVKMWGIFATACAKIINRSGTEQDATGRGGLSGVATKEFTIRYIADIDTSMRVVYLGRYFNILYVDDYAEEHRFLILKTDTGLSDG